MTTGFKWGEFQFWPHQRQLLLAGQPQALGGRALDLLTGLVEANGAVVSKDLLIERAWPGRVVQDSNLSVQIAALRKVLGKDCIATVERHGYRFAQRLETHSTEVRSDTPRNNTPGPATGETSSRRAGQRRAGDATSDATSDGTNHGTKAAASEAVRKAVSEAPSEPAPDAASEPTIHAAAGDKPSIAVLPFDKIGSGSDLDFFCDSLCEDITTDLARFSELLVMSRNSAASYRGGNVDIRRVGAELGVRYVLEGSVRTQGANGSAVRITAQLIDADTMHHVWAERYDRMAADSFELQDEISRAIVSAIAPQIEASQKIYLRQLKPADMTAYGLAMRAWVKLCEASAETDPALRQEINKQAHAALAIDPQSALARRTLAGVYWLDAWTNTTRPILESFQLGFEAASQAVQADERDHYAHTMHSLFLFASGQNAEGLMALRHAHQINPNDTRTLGWLGFYEAVAGDISKAKAYGLQALRLSVRNPERHRFLLQMSGVCIALGDYAEGLDFTRQAMADAPRSSVRLVSLAIQHVGLYQFEEARQACDEARRLSPELVASRLAGHWPGASGSYKERVNLFFRVAAGLEPPEAADAQR